MRASRSLDYESLAVAEYDAEDADEGHERADCLTYLYACPEDCRHEDYGEYRRDRRQERNVSGRGVVEREVLGDEVERAGANAADEEVQLIAPVVGKDFLEREEQQDDVGGCEPVDEHLYRSELSASLVGREHQHFGAKERRAPHAGCKKSCDVGYKLDVFGIACASLSGHGLCRF